MVCERKRHAAFAREPAAELHDRKQKRGAVLSPRNKINGSEAISLFHHACPGGTVKERGCRAGDPLVPARIRAGILNPDHRRRTIVPHKGDRFGAEHSRGMHDLANRAGTKRKPARVRRALVKQAFLQRQHQPSAVALKSTAGRAPDFPRRSRRREHPSSPRCRRRRPRVRRW